LGLLARSRALLVGPAEARQEYEDALHLLGRTRTAPQLARAHLLYGEWLRRQHRRREARGQLRAALDMFDGMGLPCFAERARVELRATGEHTQKRELGTPEELTPQEAQIAVLVSRGQTPLIRARHRASSPERRPFPGAAMCSVERTHPDQATRDITDSTSSAAP
jgi:hypothetical protein